MLHKTLKQALLTGLALNENLHAFWSQEFEMKTQKNLSIATSPRKVRFYQTFSLWSQHSISSLDSLDSEGTLLKFLWWWHRRVCSLLSWKRNLRRRRHKDWYLQSTAMPRSRDKDTDHYSDEGFCAPLVQGGPCTIILSLLESNNFALSPVQLSQSNVQFLMLAQGPRGSQ